MMFNVEKGIDVPPRKSRRGKSKYPFDQMDVGDSFLARGVKLQTLTTAAAHYGKPLGKKFTARTLDDGIRVWREEDRIAPSSLVSPISLLK